MEEMKVVKHRCESPEYPFLSVGRQAWIVLWRRAFLHLPPQMTNFHTTNATKTEMHDRFLKISRHLTPR